MLLENLRKNNHGTTVVDGQGAMGPVKIIFTIVKRKNVRKVISIIRKHNPAAFYSIEDIKNVRKGIFANIQ